MKNILFTSIGGKFTYDVISNIKKKFKKIKVIGTDTNNKIEKWFFDDFEKVCRADISKKKYIENIIKIVKKHKIEFIFANSEHESIAISLYSKKLKSLGVKTSVGKYELVKLMTDKYKMLNFLKKEGVDTGPFFKVSNLEEAERYIYNLGYPKMKVILKQRFGSGSRGIFIINNSSKNIKHLLNDRLCLEGEWNEIKEYIKNRLRTLDNFFVMPFYQGKTYDIDCLAKKGRILNLHIRERRYQNPLSPTNEGCVLVKNKKIENYCRQIVKAFEIDKVCDFDVVLDKKNKPKILDSSCRLSGSVGASILSGSNILENLILLLQNKKEKRNFKIKHNIIIKPVNKFVHHYEEK